MFTNVTYRQGTLFVPLGTRDLYTRFEGWRNFLKIQEIGSSGEQKYLALYDGSKGKTKLAVKDGENYTLVFEPETGWKINSLTYNGMDVTNQVGDDGQFTIPVITGDATLSVVYEQAFNAISSAEAGQSLKFFVMEGKVVVKGTRWGEPINVYSEDGILLKNQQADNGETVVCLKGNQLYIIKIGKQTVKVFL